jgi:hypothetical protein
MKIQNSVWVQDMAVSSFAEIFVQVGLTAEEMFNMSIEQYFRPTDSQITKNAIMADLWPVMLYFHENITNHAHGLEELEITSQMWLDRNIGKLRRMLKDRSRS